MNYLKNDMNTSNFHRTMDALFGSIMIAVYKFTGGDSAKAKEIINRVLVPLGGGYERFPKTWVETHKNDSTYSMKELMKIIDKTDCSILPFLLQIFFYAIAGIYNERSGLIKVCMQKRTITTYKEEKKSIELTETNKDGSKRSIRTDDEKRETTEISETTAMFEAYFSEKIETDKSGLFDGFTIK